MTAPASEAVVTCWLRRALKLAGLPRLPHDAFHGLRRKWATERKHLPDVDVARAGGWRSVNTMKRAYQQADDAGVLEAIMEPRKLRELQGS
jgi:integrase